VLEAEIDLSITKEELLKSVLDSNDYFEINPHAAESGLDAYSHFSEIGIKEGCLPNRIFLKQEWDSFVEFDEGPVTAWDYYHGSVDFDNLQISKKHGLFNIASKYLAESLQVNNPISVLVYAEQLCLIFDSNFYGKSNEISHLHPGLLLRHYLRFGWKNGLRPAEEYDAEAIKAIIENRDLSIRIRDAKTRIYKLREVPKSNKFTNEQLELFKQYFDSHAYAEFAELPDDLNFNQVLSLYLDGGWKAMPDTGKGFDASYYIKRYKELDGAPIAPFQHYICHGHAELRQPSSRTKEIAENYQPLVSVIVPNFNHEKFLKRRLKSIEDQTYRNFEVILLDDKSSDKSRDVLKNWAEKKHKFSVKCDFNKTNSGNAFSQWEHGMSLAEGELIWICESDDSCDTDFLETLVPHFADSSINMAVGCIEFIDTDDNHIDGMSAFRNYSEPGIWEEPITRTAAEWYAGAWGVNNIAANVGGCLLRKRTYPKHVFQTAKKYKIAGDWYLYTHVVGSGRMIYDPNAKAYFRQHGKNTSASNFDKKYYYQELADIRTHLRSLWPANDDVDLRFMRNIQAQWDRYKMKGVLEKELRSFAKKPARKALHIVIAYLGPRVGGGEFIATHIANAIANLSTKTRPIFVSLFAHSLRDPSPMLENLISDRVDRYSVETAMEYSSPKAFLEAISADVVNSHMVLNDEYFLSKSSENIDVPYVVTLHGSHQGANGNLLPDNFLVSLLSGVDLWLYTAPSNLKILRNIPIDSRAVRQIQNAMPEDKTSPETSRKSLGISKKAFVFTLVARGILRKGWRASIEAFLQLLEHDPELDIHLLLVGDGDRTIELREKYSDHSNIHFLGFQTAINGIYRLSDCALLPTRFEGESFPLCLVQSLMEGVPAIAGDVGFIRQMMTLENGKVSGFLIDPIRDTNDFVDLLASAMEEMLDKTTYKSLKANAKLAGKRYAMKDLAKQYVDLFSEVISYKKQNLSNLEVFSRES